MITKAKNRVLLIDDDFTLVEVLSMAIEVAGYDVKGIYNLNDITAILKEFSPHIVVLDVEVGDKNSIEVIPQIKHCLPTCNIIMMSSHHDSAFVVDSVGTGAEHYLKKPFKVDELLVYLNKYSGTIKCDFINIGSSKLLLNENKLSVNNGEEIHDLTRKELLLLKLLISNYNNIVSREDIANELYNGNIPSEHSVNNLVSKLRKMLSPDRSITIETLHKMGYKLC